MRHALAIFLVAAFLLSATIVFAGTQDSAMVALYPNTHLVKGDVSCLWDGTPCSDFLDSPWPLNSGTTLYLLVVRGDPGTGIAALSCGVAYDAEIQSGCDVYEWTLCASGLEYPNSGGNGEWPASGGGNRITWDITNDCQVAEYGLDGVHALAGSFYLYAYSDDLFRITANDNVASGPEFLVGDCAGSATDLPLTHAGSFGFGTVSGCNPCKGACLSSPISAESATWGSIKAHY